MTVNILTICTGKYSTFFNNFYESCEKFFLKNYKKNYFVFTDGSLIDKENIIKIDQPKLGWPNDSMMRFKMFNTIFDRLNLDDYVYFFNINMLFVNEVNEEVFPTDKHDFLMGVIHPGYHDTPSIYYPYERNSNSNFFIPYGMGQKYYQGCFNGGRVREFFEMSIDLEKKIDDDGKNNIIPVWHDESALNWYYIDKNPLSLPFSYAYPESYNIPSDKFIIQIDKDKLGGKNYLRS